MPQTSQPRDTLGKEGPWQRGKYKVGISRARISQTAVWTRCTSKSLLGRAPGWLLSPSWVTNSEQGWEKQENRRRCFLAEFSGESQGRCHPLPNLQWKNTPLLPNRPRSQSQEFTGAAGDAGQ